VSQIHPSHETQFAAVVGIDWGDKKHAWSLLPVGSDRRESGEIEHTPEAVESWVSMLSARFDGQPIAVALEQSRGALVFRELPAVPRVRYRITGPFRKTRMPGCIMCVSSRARTLYHGGSAVSSGSISGRGLFSVRSRRKSASDHGLDRSARGRVG